MAEVTNWANLGAGLYLFLTSPLMIFFSNRLVNSVGELVASSSQMLIVSIMTLVLGVVFICISGASKHPLTGSALIGAFLLVKGLALLYVPYTNKHMNGTISSALADPKTIRNAGVINFFVSIILLFFAWS